MHRSTLVATALVGCVLAILSASCGGGAKAGVSGGVTIEPLASSTVAVIGTAAQIGGKPGVAPTMSDTALPDATQPPARETPADLAAPPSSAATATAPPLLASDGSVAPVAGRWIDVDVTRFVVRLMDGGTVVREIAPVGVGAQVDTGVYESTQTGLFHVNSKVADLVYDPPYDTYISDWVGFDPDKANGFHSFLKDKDGKVVDASTGRISNGCIRTGESAAVFAFAEIGMAVWVHR